MDRFGSRNRSALLPLLAAALLFASSQGCASAFATALYLIKGHNVAAEYKGLKQKTVAVVCRPAPALGYDTGLIPRQLAEQVGRRLQKNVPKIKVIDQQDVSAWTDEHTWNEYVEIGKALKADMVVGIDLEDFSIYQGQTLYQGKANVKIKVYDVNNSGTVVFEKIPPQSIFPPNTGVSTQEKQEQEFLQQYLTVLSDEIGQHFYDHDSYASFAQDTMALD